MACLLALTFAAGIVDALSWIGLSGVFTANQTGNVLLLGMGVAGTPGVNGLPALCALTAFLLGAAIVGRMTRASPPGWTGRTTWIFALVSVTVLALAAVAWLWPPHRFAVSGLAITAVLAAAMGAQGAEAMRLAVPQLITVAVSSAVIGAGMSLLVGPSRSRASGVLRRLLAIVALATGAFTGAVLSRVGLGAGLALAGSVAAGAAVIGHRSRAVR
ncbi:YoaK family protein [Microbacterium lushaniae]|uniref:YoaK family protein n=1 Tax=Microbacterium lushaniae TaxID=2614639 RepID=UPI00178473B2|nr:YoaK family protein [Microbacterium lushaniae]